MANFETDLMNEPTLRTVEEALARAQKLHYPVQVHPAYALSGWPRYVAENSDELESLALKGFEMSPTAEIKIRHLEEYGKDA